MFQKIRQAIIRRLTRISIIRSMVCEIVQQDIKDNGTTKKVIQRYV